MRNKWLPVLTTEAQVFEQQPLITPFQANDNLWKYNCRKPDAAASRTVCGCPYLDKCTSGGNKTQFQEYLRSHVREFDWDLHAHPVKKFCIFVFKFCKIFNLNLKLNFHYCIVKYVTLMQNYNLCTLVCKNVAYLTVILMAKV